MSNSIINCLAALNVKDESAKQHRNKMQHMQANEVAMAGAPHIYVRRRVGGNYTI